MSILCAEIVDMHTFKLPAVWILVRCAVRVAVVAVCDEIPGPITICRYFRITLIRVFRGRQLAILECRLSLPGTRTLLKWNDLYCCNPSKNNQRCHWPQLRPGYFAGNGLLYGDTGARR